MRPRAFWKSSLQSIPPMNDKPSPEVALQNLISASRLAPLTADQHELLRISAEVIAEKIKPTAPAN